MVLNQRFIPTIFCLIVISFLIMESPKAGLVDAMFATEDLTKKYSRLYSQASQGNASAQHRLAVMCRNGEGTLKDPVEAVKWFRKAAEQGKVESQEQLALALLSGNGVGQDDIEAARWVGLAARQNSPSALYMLANMNLTGQGIKKDKQKAYSLFEKSASFGYTKSMLKQADMLIYGKGVEKNVYSGILLYEQAARAGDNLAKFRLPELEKQKLCLFSAKTQLFGKYLKCVSGKELQMKLSERGGIQTEESDKTRKLFNSQAILKGSRDLELNLTKDDRVARIKYVFDLSGDEGQVLDITKLRNMLVRKYGNYQKAEGVLGAGSIRYSWILKDKLNIALHQKSSRSDIHLEYYFSQRLEAFYTQREIEKQKILENSYVVDTEVF